MYFTGRAIVSGENQTGASSQKARVGLQKSKPLQKPVSEDFADLDISSEFQTIKEAPKKVPDEYEIAMTGPAAFMEPAPAKVSKPGDEVAAQKESSEKAADMAASIKQVSPTTTPKQTSAGKDDQIGLEGPLRIEPSAVGAIEPSNNEVSSDTETQFAIVLPSTTEQASLAPEAEFVPLKSGISSASKNLEGLSRSECAARFKTVALSGAINFESGSANLLRSSRPILHFFAAVYRNCSQFQVTIAGHTDSQGNAGFNQKLSENRAISVAQYLVEIGVPGENLKVVGYGEARPLASNDTALKRGRNRRIEFTIDDG